MLANTIMALRREFTSNPLQNIASNTSQYIAPFLLSTIFQAFEVGFILNQFFSWIPHANEEKLVVKFIVAFVLIVGG